MTNQGTNTEVSAVKAARTPFIVETRVVITMRRNWGDLQVIGILEDGNFADMVATHFCGYGKNAAVNLTTWGELANTEEGRVAWNEFMSGVR